MNLTTTKTVRELATESPHAARVLEKLGIDYCCGGNKSLEEACASAHLTASEVLESLAAAASAGEPEGRDWMSAPLSALAEHIIARHHRYTREEIARLGPLFDKVCSVHGANHPELPRMRSIFQGLAEELSLHMIKEERMLFPYIMAMEEAAAQGRPVQPPPFGTVQNPVAMMMHEHDSAGEALRALRQASAGYALPSDACTSFRTLFGALQELEADLHRHIHLENNILFPRAVELERGA